MNICNQESATIQSHTVYRIVETIRPYFNKACHNTCTLSSFKYSYSLLTLMLDQAPLHLLWFHSSKGLQTWIKIVGINFAPLLGGRYGERPDSGEDVIDDGPVGQTSHDSLVLRRKPRVPIDFAEIELETALALLRASLQVVLARQHLMSDIGYILLPTNNLGGLPTTIHLSFKLDRELGGPREHLCLMREWTVSVNRWFLNSWQWIVC